MRNCQQLFQVFVDITYSLLVLVSLGNRGFWSSFVVDMALQSEKKYFYWVAPLLVDWSQPLQFKYQVPNEVEYNIE